MIFLYLLSSLLTNNNALAQPLLLHIYPREVISPKFTNRSELNIIWSCLVTLFACSWVAVHPNIPAPSDSSQKIFIRRLSMMLYMLLAPEIVIIWAGRQYYAANEIVQRNKERGWTRTHGFFALMGGFTLYEDGVMSRILAPEELEHLFADGQIDWPKISEKAINDRSKGDFLSKGFAVLQTTWFITQCIARGVYGLALSQLEIVTVAFAALNAVVYFLWWNKPMDVACSIPIHLLPPLPSAQSSSSKRETGIQTANPCRSETGGSQHSSPESSTLLSGLSETKPIDVDDPQFVAKLEIEPSQSSIPPSSTFARICSYIWGKFLSMGPFALLYILIFKPVIIIWSNLHDMLQCDEVDNTHGTQSVPTFYAPNSQNTGLSTTIGLGISILFGGIHCAPWSFPFPSFKEQQLWRISAVAITVLPISVVLLFTTGALIVSALFKDLQGPWATSINVFLGLFVSLMLLAYTVARITLLILPLLALRSLSSGSFVSIDWLSFIPHI